MDTMIARIWLLTLLISGFLVSSTDARAQPFLSNGDFEAGSAGASAVIPSWMEIDSPDVSVPGGLGIDTPPGGQNPDFILASGSPASPNGGQFVLLRNEPVMGITEGVSQLVTGLIPGATYAVTFHQSNGGIEDFRIGLPDQEGSGSLDVSFAGVTQATPTMTFEGFGAQTWESVNLEFTATADSHLLEISAVGYIGGGASNIGRISLDGVEVRRVNPVPSISTWGVVALTTLIVGAALTLLRRWRDHGRQSAA